MNVFIFQDLFFYMEHIIFLGIIANRSISLLSRLYRFYDTRAISNLTNETGHLDTYDFHWMDIQMSHSQVTYIMKCTYRFGMYAVPALPIRPPCAIESCWPPRISGMYVVHTPLASWIRNGQVLIRDIIRSGIAINAPHVCHPCAIDAQLIRNTWEIVLELELELELVAPQMFHQTTSAILRIFSYAVRALWHRRPVEQGH